MMRKTFKRLFDALPADAPSPGHERRHLHLAVAALLHEARRADYKEGDDESIAAQLALVDLFGVDQEQAAALLAQGRDKAQQLTSFYAPVSTIKRDWSMAERVRLVEHLWRITFADGRLDHYEDHYVRKIAHLLYVPHTENMLARNRARDAVAG
jgi:uncharacterized tellurite resistance protein B-like protein